MAATKEAEPIAPTLFSSANAAVKGQRVTARHKETSRASKQETTEEDAKIKPRKDFLTPPQAAACRWFSGVWWHEVPSLRASADLFYRSLLGFYAMQSKRLKINKWQVPSLVNAILSSFGLPSPPSVTKQFAARLQLLDAPGLHVDYWAHQKTDLLASLAGYTAFVSRHRQVTLTGGVILSPVLRLHSSERKDIFLQEMSEEKQTREQTGKIFGRPQPRATPAASREMKQKNQVIVPPTPHFPSRVANKRKLVNTGELPSVWEFLSPREKDINGQGTRKQETLESKNTVFFDEVDDGRNGDALSVDEDRAQCDVTWQTLYPPPVPLHLVPSPRKGPHIVSDKP